MEVGVSVLPKLPRDAGDRNRTSPFAFTGNKFEFRAVGGLVSIAGPNTVLNTIVAESLDFIATQLEVATKGGKALNKAIQELLPGILKETQEGRLQRRQLLRGVAHRGREARPAEPAATPSIRCRSSSARTRSSCSPSTRSTASASCRAATTIFSEKYVKEVNIEASMMVMMAKTMILPAALRYQGRSPRR